MKNVAAGDGYLIVAYRPFPQLQPYAETGPIFLHAEEWRTRRRRGRAAGNAGKQRLYRRGYGKDDRIVYGSGAVTPTGDIAARATTLLERDEIAYIHVRSARNNCYQCRIERA
ncbi:DUF1203 domain-containing protein [Mesorhizobium atlanticum]